MNECFYYTLVLHTRQLKEDNEKKLKTKRWAVRSPWSGQVEVEVEVEVKWPVRWVEQIIKS